MVKDLSFENKVQLVHDLQEHFNSDEANFFTEVDESTGQTNRIVKPEMQHNFNIELYEKMNGNVVNAGDGKAAKDGQKTSKGKDAKIYSLGKMPPKAWEGWLRFTSGVRSGQVRLRAMNVAELRKEAELSQIQMSQDAAAGTPTPKASSGRTPKHKRKSTGATIVLEARKVLTEEKIGPNTVVSVYYINQTNIKPFAVLTFGICIYLFFSVCNWWIVGTELGDSV
jgi:hypothetical protein